MESSTYDDVSLTNRTQKLSMISSHYNLSLDHFFEFFSAHTYQSILVFLTIIFIYYVYKFYNTPLKKVKLFEQVGYLQKKKEEQNIRQQMKQKRKRKVGNIPPPFPNGWFSLCLSSELKVKEIKQVDCLGQNLAVFRGEDGKAHVLDAYCPHLGANLAVGGEVEDNCVRCPFHGWSFRGDDGKCVDIPYAKSIPPIAKTRAWTVLELNGCVHIWHDAEGREPYWYPPEIKEITNGEWTYEGLTEHYVNAHIQEIPENGADVAHLDYLHSPFIISGTDLRTTHHTFTQMRHKWTPQWQPSSEEKHIAHLQLHHDSKFFGFSFPILEINVSALQIGPGLVYLYWDTFFGKGVFVQTLLPVEPLLQQLCHVNYAASYIPKWFTKFFLFGEMLQVERDVMIWNNKTFNAQPLLIQEDKLINQFRRWYSQFYSEHSSKIGDCKLSW